MMYAVAIITRTKDRPLLLERAANSVLAQTFKEWLWVIVNDGGDPVAVTNVIERYSVMLAGRVLRIDHPISMGMEAASNAGIRASQSKYLVIHDDDDSWEPEFLETTIGALKNPPHPLVRAAITHCTEIKEQLVGDRVIEISRQSYNGYLNNLLLLGFLRENKTPPICFLYEREVHQEIGMYDEELRVLGDWEFYLRFYQRYEGIVIRRHLANYHIRPVTSPGLYGNSVTAGIDLHAFHAQILWNRLLRLDLVNGNSGIGTLAATVQSTEIAARRMDFSLSFLAPALAARSAGCKAVIICGAGAAGRRAAQLARLLGLYVECFTDRNPSLQGNIFDGIPVRSLREGIAKRLPFIIGSLTLSSELQTDIKALATDMNYPTPTIYCPEPLI